MRRFNIDEVMLRNNGADQAAAETCLTRFLEAAPPDVRGVTDLPPTEGERAAMDACFRGLGAVLAGLGLGPVAIDRTMIHIVAPDDFRRAFAPPTIGAVAYGHAYVPRRETAYEFVRIFSHELAHLASWHVIRLDVAMEDGQLTTRPHALRSGFVLGGLYTGINEAMTETIAVDIRREVLRTTTLVTDSAGFWNLRDGIDYTPQVLLLRDVSERLGTSQALIDQLYRDYFTGSLHSLGDFFRPWRELHPVLGPMGTGARHAFDAAQALGLPDTAEKIRPFLAVG